MSTWQQPLIRLNIEKQDQIVDIDTDIFELIVFSIDEWIALIEKHGCDGLDDEASFVERDLQRVGNGSRVDSAIEGEEFEFVRG